MTHDKGLSYHMWQVFRERRAAAGEGYLGKRDLPLCGAKCRDGHVCQAKAIAWWSQSAELWYVVNGRCKNHGGLSTGPRTADGKRRCAEASRQRAMARKLSL